jgi:hypothetical protein
MRHIALGDRRYRIMSAERDGQWTAQAQHEDNGDPFGVECAAATEDEAIARLTRWLEWQADHAEALADLQRAERAYHRTIAGSAFAGPSEGPTAIELQKESLDVLEAARIRLDEIRTRRPAT